ncbi:MAG: serine--tRNA ligase [Lentisphaerae bacterium]|jgi:seryl-tRNA synthetase|nr:serine--tRNA ligase [Lentisphaerota bacterium]
MIDIRILRENPELVKENAARRGCDVNIDELRALDQQYLATMKEVENLRAERNRLSKECKTNPAARETVRELKVTLTELEKQLDEQKKQVDEKLAWLPNFLSEDVPDGKDDADNLEIKQVGGKPSFDFAARDHQALGDLLGIIDTARGAKVAQSGFYYWVGKGAQLAQAMFFWAQQELVKRGFTLFMSPCAAKSETLFGTGYLPFFEDQSYNLTGEDLALIGTSEQTLVGYHAEEILEGASLPLCYTAYTPCFRTEAGSYGKESRGIFRVHQFHKVEQIIFCKPEDSPRCHEICLDNEEYLLQQLGIPYRVVNVCVGDMGAPGYKKYDIEAWYPGFGAYREVTSNTNLTDFQSRRLNIRFKDTDGNRGFVHTISATGVTDRVVCAIMENFQQADGSVVVPEVLRPLTGFDVITP